MQKIKPVEITAEREKKTLTIFWSDGRRCSYPFGALRKACPCAECRSNPNTESAPDPAEMELQLLDLPIVDTRSTQLRQLELVGNYALNITWEDGHHFGIYNWAYLRDLCEAFQEPSQNNL